MVKKTYSSSVELGAIYKTHSRYRVALVYPNSYYIGMSNLGVHSIYYELNKREDTYCERVFFEEGDKLPLSIETKSRLRNFDILAFSISYELDYLNMKQLLQDSSIPVRNTERREALPVLIAGGIVTHFNFKALLGVMDAVVVGEGEILIHKFMDEFGNFFSQGRHPSKGDFLERLSKIEGFFVQGKSERAVIEEIADIDSFETCSRILTPSTEFSNTFLIQLSRGCPFKCNFCVSAYMYKQVRFRDYQRVLETAQKGLRWTNRIGLIGASLPNYPKLDLLCKELRKMNALISFSSLRVDFITEEILKTLVESGQHSITIAPESGSERLRKLINKPITDERIIDAVKKAKVMGIKVVKMYFMIGLPDETSEDVAEIARLSNSISRIVKLKISVAPFVPKPNTPFEKKSFKEVKILKEKIRFLKNTLKSNIPASFESPRLAYLEYQLANADENTLFSLFEKTHPS